jgi:hypothetical protein
MMNEIIQKVVCHSCFWFDYERQGEQVPYEPAEEPMPEGAIGCCPDCGEYVYPDGPAPEEDRNRWYSEYAEEFEGWDWDAIKLEASADMQPDDDNPGVMAGRSYLGSVLTLTPSGKIYMPWATGNITEYEAARDEEWREALEKAADDHGMYMDYFDDGIFACYYEDMPETDEDTEENFNEE